MIIFFSLRIRSCEKVMSSVQKDDDLYVVKPPPSYIYVIINNKPENQIDDFISPDETVVFCKWEYKLFGSTVFRQDHNTGTSRWGLENSIITTEEKWIYDAFTGAITNQAAGVKSNQEAVITHAVLYQKAREMMQCPRKCSWANCIKSDEIPKRCSICEFQTDRPSYDMYYHDECVEAGINDELALMNPKMVTHGCCLCICNKVTREYCNIDKDKISTNKTICACSNQGKNCKARDTFIEFKKNVDGKLQYGQVVSSSIVHCNQKDCKISIGNDEYPDRPKKATLSVLCSKSENRIQCSFCNWDGKTYCKALVTSESQSIWETTVDKVQKAAKKSSNATLFSDYNIPFTLDKLNPLIKSGKNWLNDEIVNGFLQGVDDHVKQDDLCYLRDPEKQVSDPRHIVIWNSFLANQFSDDYDLFKFVRQITKNGRVDFFHPNAYHEITCNEENVHWTKMIIDMKFKMLLIEDTYMTYRNGIPSLSNLQIRRVLGLVRCMEFLCVTTKGMTLENKTGYSAKQWAEERTGISQIGCQNDGADCGVLVSLNTCNNAIGDANIRLNHTQLDLLIKTPRRLMLHCLAQGGIVSNGTHDVHKDLDEWGSARLRERVCSHCLKNDRYVTV